MAELRHERALQVRRFGGRCHDDRPHGVVSHAGCAIGLVLEGWAEMEIHGRLRAEAGSLMVLPSGTPHRLVDRSDDYASLAVGFCPSCLTLSEAQPLLAPVRRIRRGAVPIVRLEPARRDRMVGLLEELEREISREGPESGALERALLQLVLGEVCRAMPAPMELPGATLAARALAWTQEHALQPVSLKDVAAAVGSSPSHLATVVRRETGHTVGQWLTSIRVAAAGGWLLHSDASIDEIAGRVGWKDTTHFIRQFRKVTGETPAAWRRRERLSPSASSSDAG